MSNFRRSLPPLNSLAAFEAAFRLNSFTYAADELSLSQASISRQIRELEQDLGTKLFERHRYRVSPTEAGCQLAAAVRPALSELSEISNRIRTENDGSTTMTVYSDMSLGNAFVAPCIGEFQRLYPEVSLRIISAYGPIETLTEPFDIGLQYGRWAEDMFTIQPLADDLIYPVCSQSLAQQFSGDVSPAELVQHPLLHLNVPSRNWPNWRSFLAYFRHKEPEPDQKLVFSSYQICLDVAERGEGIALGWHHAVKERIALGRLFRIPGTAMPLHDIVCIYRKKNSKPNANVDNFVKLLRQKVEDLPSF